MIDYLYSDMPPMKPIERTAWEHDVRILTELLDSVVRDESEHADRGFMTEYEPLIGAYLVAGIVSIRNGVALIRIHMPGDHFTPRYTTALRARIADLLTDGNADRMTTWYVATFEPREYDAACIMHEECAADPTMGRLCFRAARGERT